MPDNLEQQLPGTVQSFRDAIHSLIGIRHDTLTIEPEDAAAYTKAVVRGSAYSEIVEAVSGHQGLKQGRSVARSKPPLWIDAVSLCDDIDKTTRAWTNDPAPDVTTRLYAIGDTDYRPQDVPDLARATRTILHWVSKIEELLSGDVEHKWELTAACPACGSRYLRRQDTSGDWVRTAALSITAKGCVCGACQHAWGPGQFDFLAKVLETQAPSDISTGNALEVR